MIKIFSVFFGTLCLSIFTMAQPKTDISKLPLTTFNKSGNKHLVFYFTGDGGLNSFSQKVCEELAQKNYTVVSLDTRKYFWDTKTPDKLSQDATEVVEHYLKQYNKAEFSLLGYSFGADAAIFFSTRLPKNLQQKFKSAVLLSPSTSTDFTVKVADLLGFGSKEGKYKTMPELNKVQAPVLCIFGTDEDSDFYKNLKEKRDLEKVQIPGSHKYDNDIKKLISTIEKGL
ncbi:AcvB/VirJ family lysyl-phosphatidylglycerol hydrolase [Pedobacter nototheniae]|uniref:AcvB/VirJ family lysyl-phosphatidylglycerol hydrolase n=1 Tax=Pedobacter nototheniae TaxID=2488994 RepID=UPI0010409F57|nr:AcvB/VirJ family lysyl-phosphatidylglycerol hydrolase [Pedobacter nototheniae]